MSEDEVIRIASRIAQDAVADHERRFIRQGVVIGLIFGAGLGLVLGWMAISLCNLSGRI